MPSRLLFKKGVPIMRPCSVDNFANSVPWTEEEKQIIRDNGHLGHAVLVELLPTRTYNSIRKKSKSIGVDVPRMVLKGPKRAWLPHEDDFLRENDSLTKYQIAEALGRTSNGVYYRSKILGVTLGRRFVGRDGKAQTVHRWTEEDDRNLREMSSRLSMQEAADALGRTVHAVKSRSMKLNLRWRDRRLSVARLAKYLNVSKATIRRHRDKNGLRFRKNDLTAKPPSDRDLQIIAQSILETAAAQGNGSRLLKMARGEWDSVELCEH